jgi:endonuclease G
MRKVAILCVVLFLGSLGISADTSSPVSITTLGAAITEDFNSLAQTGTSAATPVGWGFVESGTNANATYTAGTGSSNSGDTYSFGAASSQERALGQLRSGSLIATIGAAFINNTGSTITSLAISYAGEQWRFGGAHSSIAERMDFQYSTNATSLTAGTYVDVNELDFVPPVTSGTAGLLDGNAARVNLGATITGLNIPAGATFFIRWTDVDATGADDGLAIDDFAIVADGTATDSAPAVASTTPSAGSTNVAVDTSITITFSEPVNATASAFSLSCDSTPQPFAQSASPGSSITLTPSADLPFGATCTVAIAAAEVTDADTQDPPDQLAASVNVSFSTADAEPPPVATNLIINELDSDQNSTDTGEFIEIYDGGVGHTPLDGLTLVFYNGSNDLSYFALDLDGRVTDASGYFVVGNAAVPGVGLTFADNFLQNGQDAVALFAANASDFPNGTAVTQTNLIDAVVYDTDDADDPGLLPLLNASQPQVNENGGGNGTGQSIGRCENGTGGARNTSTYTTGLPTPGAPNNCPPPPPPPSPSTIVISQIYGAGGTSGAAYQNDYVELFNRGTETVDVTGWTLQYAAAAGSGWDFNKTPLGGPIAPGEYYLIKLASNGATGAALPPTNVAGNINMSGTQGKIAIVDSFDALAGNCPLTNPHLKDLVGYGGADCGEGNTTAPAASTTDALYRRDNGATDTDFNSLDFTTGAPGPRRTAPIVELGPYLMASDPSTNDFNVPRDPTIALTFTEPVTTTDPWFDLTCAASGSHNSYTRAGSGVFIDITPNVPLQPGETCTITVFKDGVRDEDTDDSGPNTDTLPANYSWSFTVAAGTAPPYPPSVHLTFGNPSNAVDDVNQFDNYLMEKPEYALSYNRDLGRPNWVSWHLTPEWYGSLARVDTFRADPQVPPDWYRVQGFDFSGSGFDRGHMVPNADRDKETSVPINQATYLMTNMVAQAPGNNQGPWAAMENDLRGIADQGNELYIVAGPQGMGGTGSAGFANTITNGHVTVPESTWKVVLVLPQAAGNDVSRASCATRSIAVIMPNVDSIRETDWHTYLTTVDAVESLTGYDFFANLPDNVEYCVEAGTDGVNPPADVTPPVIQCAAPDGAWHGANVTLACTVTDAESGLANMADASFTLATLVPDGTEDGNAATDARTVCDRVGNCATAGPIAGNKIDRKKPGITLTTPANGGVYQLNKTVAAAFNCTDGGSGATACTGTAANGAAINTSSVGAKTFSVTATDAVGNATSTTVSYTVAAGGISINNMPDVGYVGQSFTPTFTYAGDGATSVTTTTPAKCSVSGGVVTFLKPGACSLIAHAAATAGFDAAAGPKQSVAVIKRTPSISITNLPTNARVRGSFTPAFAYDGDADPQVVSLTPLVCHARGDGSVVFTLPGPCVLLPFAEGTSTVTATLGWPQWFDVRR